MGHPDVHACEPFLAPFHAGPRRPGRHPHREADATPDLLLKHQNATLEHTSEGR